MPEVKFGDPSQTRDESFWRRLLPRRAKLLYVRRPGVLDRPRVCRDLQLAAAGGTPHRGADDDEVQQTNNVTNEASAASASVPEAASAPEDSDEVPASGF